MADEVGLGKTIEAGVVAKEYLLRGLARTVLILTPASLVSQWWQEMTVKLQMRFAVLRRGNPDWEKADLVLASLATAKRGEYAAQLWTREWDLVIVDEAHHLKNTATANWQFVNQIRKKFLLLLTATPVQNDLRELYNLITLLKPGQLQTYRKFRQEFMEDRQVAKNLHRLHQLLDEVMVRTTRHQSMIGFPSRRVKTIAVNSDPAEREFYDCVLQLAREAYSAMPTERKNLLPLLALLREAGSCPTAVASTLARMQSGFFAQPGMFDQTLADAVHRVQQKSAALPLPSKARCVLELVAARRAKVLVFTEFRATAHLLHRVLSQAGIETVVYHGGLTPDAKEDAVYRFGTTSRVMVSTEAGGEGRNLQFCHTLINYDLPWNPMRVEQRIGRLHRLGQTQDVTVINLCTNHTVEAYVLELLERKLTMFQDVIGDIEGILFQADDRSFQQVVGEAVLSHSHEAEVERVIGSYGNSIAQAVSLYRKAGRLNRRLFDQR